MKTILYFITLVLMAGLLLIQPAYSDRPLMLSLGQLDRLLGITQDLEEHTPVYIRADKKNPDKDCLCACRDFGNEFVVWSCTSVECSVHEQACELPSLSDQK